MSDESTAMSPSSHKHKRHKAEYKEHKHKHKKKKGKKSKHKHRVPTMLMWSHLISSLFNFNVCLFFYSFVCVGNGFVLEEKL